MFSDNYDGTFIGTTDKCNARNFKPDAAGLFYYGAAKICCKKILGNAYHIRMGKIYNLSDLYNHCPDCTSDKFWQCMFLLYNRHYYWDNVYLHIPL